MRTPLHTVLPVLLVGALAITALSGCTPEPKPSASASSSPRASSSPSASPDAASPSPSAAAGTGTPVAIACDTLVSRQTMYDFNPNFGLDDAFSPKSGTPAATAKADKGVACNWLNQTSGDTVTIAVAQPSADELAMIAATAAKGTAVSGLGSSAYFSSAGQVGRVDVFDGRYWLVATSVYFSTADDARALVTSAVGAL